MERPGAPPRIPPAAVSRGIFVRAWSVVAASVLILGLARIAMWFAYAGSARVATPATLLRALAKGLRYDLVVGGIGALLVLLIAAPFLALRGRASRSAAVVAHTVALFLIVVLALLAAVEFHYQGFYHERFGPMVFGLLDDDTRAILTTVWHDYPVGLWLPAFAVLAMTAHWVLRRLHGRGRKPVPAGTRRGWVRAVLILAQLLVFLLLARGSLGVFPLVRQDVVFSPDPFVNQLVLNAPITLYKAARAKKKEIDLGDDQLAGLKALGFTSLADAAQAAGLADPDEAAIRRALFPVAPGAPRAERPNVVLALLESLSYDLYLTDAPNNDMLGRLRPHLTHDTVFHNFWSGQNGTHSELENLLLGSPISPLTQGEAGRVALATSAALPFRRQGYRTVFLYGGGSDWRDVGRVFRTQGFDEIHDQRAVRARFPEARATAWGIYDAYLFRYAEALLQEAQQSKTPIFIFLLTTTNHPPFELDTPRRDLPLDPQALGARGNPDAPLRARILATYQYQNDEFGGFLDAIEHGASSASTIVAAAGDHNLRDHYQYTLPEEQPDVDRVLALLRLPEGFAVSVDGTRFATHGDLVPTLVSLALPGEHYFATGSNLAAPLEGVEHALASYARTYFRDGVAFGLRDPRWHPWTLPYRRIAAQGAPPSAEQAAAIRRIAAGVALRDWYLRSSVIAARGGRG